MVKEYKKFFVPKYCSAATFYLFLVIMLILPRKLFKLPNEQGNKDDKLSKHFLKSLSEDDKTLLKETFGEYYKNDDRCALNKRT